MPVDQLSAILHIKSQKNDPHRTEQIGQIDGLVPAVPSEMDLVLAKP